MRDIARLMLRIVLGGLLAGHGAQKLFGAFGGPGLHGLAGWLESMGMKPGHRWAKLAAGAEFGGGTLTALGFLNPLGPLGIISAMSVASFKVHGGKPIWATEGGAELPLTNIAAAVALAMVGPGKYSLDRLFGFKLPWPVVSLLWAATAAGTLVAIQQEPEMPERAPMTEGQTEAMQNPGV